MPFCANCGSDVQGRFCAKCGTPVAAAPPPPAGGPAYTPPPPAGGAYNPPPPPAGGAAYSAPPPPAGAAQAGLQENVAAALCYLLGVLTAVLFLVLEPYNRNRNIRFHAFQSLFVWIGMVVIGIAFGIVSNIIAFLPFIGWLVVLLMWPLFGIACFGLWLMLMYKAYNGERWVLPVVGPMAEKQA